MSLTRKEHQTFIRLMSEACEDDPEFAAEVTGRRWSRLRLLRVVVALCCFAGACLVLVLGIAIPEGVTAGVLFLVGTVLVLRAVMAGSQPPRRLLLRRPSLPRARMPHLRWSHPSLHRPRLGRRAGSHAPAPRWRRRRSPDREPDGH